MKIENTWYRVSVKAVIYDNQNRILLCKESSGVWDLPGGGLDHGESDFDCLKRELFEEMGLEVVSISSVPECFVTAHKSKSKTRPWIANICYEVQVENLNFIPSDECVEIGFFSLNDMKTLNILTNVKEFILVKENIGKK